MGKDVHTILHECQSCAKVEAQLLLAIGPVQFVAIDNLGLLPRTMNGNLHVVIMTERFCKWTWAIPRAEINFSQIGLLLLNNWVKHDKKPS